MTVEEICRKAKEHVPSIALAPSRSMNAMLQAAAAALRANTMYLIDENGRDIEACTRGPQFIDRLRLNRERIEGIAAGLEKLIALPSPVGEVMERYTTPNGMEISRVRVPLGVIGIIYEARPNVTADAIGLCIKSGNAVVLRGSKDAIHSNRAIVSVVKEAIAKLKLDPEFIQLIEDTDRASSLALMKMNGLVDVIIPRGGAALIRDAVQNSTVPIIETGTGNCHAYIHSSADPDMAETIILNGKLRRPSVCNALESLLVDEDVVEKILPRVLSSLRKNGVEIRGCEKTCRIFPDCVKATEEDFYTEFLDLKISCKVVKNYREAIEHINKYGSGHSETIISSDEAAEAAFMKFVDSAAVYHNASTAFTDGFEFGLGAEMGISTQKLHARGPLGLKELTSTKYCIFGNGQTRK